MITTRAITPASMSFNVTSYFMTTLDESSRNPHNRIRRMIECLFVLANSTHYPVWIEVWFQTRYRHPSLGNRTPRTVADRSPRIGRTLILKILKMALIILTCFILMVLWFIDRTSRSIIEYQIAI